MYSFEKSGGTAREERKIEAFREILIECQLEDMGYSGVRNKYQGKIRQGVANEKWKLLFPTGTILEKLEKLQRNLKEWANSIKKGREGLKKKLTKELGMLLAKERDDNTIAKIIDTKVHLNMEIDRNEIY
ncbi:hypothetical protein EPI10_007183 [Gossypium australe]|uniref:Reverse transcriptase n=1 Tax=Gossypium australe TaxID=47621 RepID=A0A5B6WW81_9ROSI|nr:hypothetical protein EPI10_007183 [Gossypium australe]